MKINKNQNEQIQAERKNPADKKGKNERAEKKEGEDFASILKKKGKKKPDAKGEADTRARGDASEKLVGKEDQKLIGERDGRKPVADETGRHEQADKLFSKEMQADRSTVARKETAIHQQRKADVKAQVESGARIASDGTRDDQPIKQVAEAPVQGIDGNPQNQMGVGEAAPNTGADPAKKEELQKLISKMVEKIQVGEDARKRKTIIMQVEVPGRGQVNVRLRKDGDSYDLRLRAKDPSFAHALKSEQGELRRMGAEKGLRFTRIDVVQ